MEIIFLSLLFLLFTSAFFLQLIFKKSGNSNQNLPPSPPALPLIGHLYLLSPVITKCLHEISSKHGPFLHLRLGSRPFLVVSSAEFAAEIYKRNDITFSTKPKAAFDDSLLFGSSSFITAPYGEYWRFMKKLCATDLLGTKQILRSKGVRGEELMISLEKLVEKASKNESIELGNELMKLTNNTICRMLMNTRCSKEDDEAEKCRKLVKGSLDLAGKMAVVTMLGPFKKFGVWLNRKELEDITREFHKLFDKIIKEHEERAKVDDNKDLMDILLKVYHDENAEFKISNTQIKAFLLDLLIAGTDTSGNTMEWIMAELINHPNVMKKLRKEIESVVGTKKTSGRVRYHKNALFASSCERNAETSPGISYEF